MRSAAGAPGLVILCAANTSAEEPDKSDPAAQPLAGHAGSPKPAAGTAAQGKQPVVQEGVIMDEQGKKKIGSFKLIPPGTPEHEELTKKGEAAAAAGGGSTGR